MSHPDAPGADNPEPIDTTDTEDAQLLLADPDDYHQAQRLREIHQARQQVHKTLREIDRYTTSKAHQKQRRALADAVAAYTAELEPLITATDYDDSVAHGPWETLRQYTTMLGSHPDADEDTPTYQVHMLIFQQANQFLAEVKPLITEDETTEWEV